MDTVHHIPTADGRATIEYRERANEDGVFTAILSVKASLGNWDVRDNDTSMHFTVNTVRIALV